AARHRFEHLGRYTGRRADGDTDDAELGDAVTDFGLGAHLGEHRRQSLERLVDGITFDDEGHLLAAVTGALDALDDHVDADAGMTERREDVSSDTGSIRHRLQVN